MKVSDAKITRADIDQIKTDIKNREWHRDVKQIIDSEPELTVAITELLERIKASLTTHNLNPDEIGALNRQIGLLLWVPMVALDRAHRRLWTDFLPDETSTVKPEGDGK